MFQRSSKPPKLTWDAWDDLGQPGKSQVCQSNLGKPRAKVFFLMSLRFCTGQRTWILFGTSNQIIDAVMQSRHDVYVDKKEENTKACALSISISWYDQDIKQPSLLHSPRGLSFSIHHELSFSLSQRWLCLWSGQWLDSSGQVCSVWRICDKAVVQSIARMWLMCGWDPPNNSPCPGLSHRTLSWGQLLWRSADQSGPSELGRCQAGQGILQDLQVIRQCSHTTDRHVQGEHFHRGHWQGHDSNRAPSGL